MFPDYKNMSLSLLSCCSSNYAFIVGENCFRLQDMFSWYYQTNVLDKR